MDDFIKQIKARLLKEKENLDALHHSFNEGGLNQSMRDSIGELSMYDNDPADIGSELFEREKDFTLRDNVHTQIVEVEKALKHIENGTYGICEGCGKQIPKERLEVMPTATNCIKCQGKEEQHSNQVHSGSQDLLQQRLDLLHDNDYSARYGDTVEMPNLYDDWDEHNGWVEAYENLEVEFDKDTGMFVAKNPPQADVNYKYNDNNGDRV